MIVYPGYVSPDLGKYPDQIDPGFHVVGRYNIRGGVYFYITFNPKEDLVCISLVFINRENFGHIYRNLAVESGEMAPEALYKCCHNVLDRESFNCLLSNVVTMRTRWLEGKKAQKGIQFAVHT
jgi:hypothetical protein